MNHKTVKTIKSIIFYTIIGSITLSCSREGDVATRDGDVMKSPQLVTITDLDGTKPDYEELRLTEYKTYR